MNNNNRFSSHLANPCLILDTLHNTRTPFQTLIESSFDIIFLVNQEGIILYASPSMQRVLGYDSAEFVGQNGFEIVYADDMEIARRLLTRILQNPSIPQKAEFRLLHKAGSWLWIEGVGTNLLNNLDVGAIVFNFRDVTERKRSESALHESERFAHSTVDALSAHIAILDDTGTIIAVNQAWRNFAKANGISSLSNNFEGVNYLSVCDTAIGQDAALATDFANGIRAVMQGHQEDFMLEYPCHSPSEQRWFVGRVTRFLGNGPVRVVIAHENITSRKLVENELTSLYNATSFLFKSDSLFNLGYQVVQAILTQFQHVDCGLLLKEKMSGKIIRLTRGGVYQVSASNPLSINGQGIVPEALRTGNTIYSPDTAADSRYLASDPRTRSELAIPLKTTIGTLGVLDLQSTELDAFSQRDQRILIAFAERSAAAIETMQLYEEINQRAGDLEWRVAKRTAGLQRAKDQVEAILNQSSDAIILVSSTPHIQQINPAFSDLMGYTFDEAFKQDIRLLADSASTTILVEAIEMAVAKNQPRRIEVVLQRKNGTTFDADVAIAPMAQFETDNVRVICSIRDNTEQKRAEEDLRKALSIEKELNELKSRFVSMVSHDFRTPLATIQSSSDLLRHYNARLTDERKQEHFNTIQGQIEHLTGLLDDVITINQAESAGLAFRPIPTDLAKLCQTIADEIQLVIGTHQIKLTVTHQMGLVEVDAKLLRRAIVNLLSNAVKYSPKGSLIAFNLFCGNKQIVISIKDQGIGIPEDDQKHLFEVFHRAENVGCIPGTGLGLAIVKRAVEAHNGSITVDSQVGDGTTFTIFLPLNCEKAEQE